MSQIKHFRKFFFIFVFVSLFSAVFCYAIEPEDESMAVKISKEAEQIFEELVSIRRDIHSHPELSMQEVRTAGIIAKKLSSLGLEVRTNIGGHGVVGILRGGLEGPVVAYRADMDALPQDIREDVPYKSQTPGVSHACGHDIHVTVGLGIAQVLSTLKDQLPGTVLFIFQPAEENISGAKAMLADGVLDDPTPDAIFAIHVGPLEVGLMATLPGVGLPGYDYFSIKLTGGSDPEAAAKACRDAIRAMSTVNFPRNDEEYQRIVGALLEENGILEEFILAVCSNIVDSPDGGKTVNGFFKASGEETYEKAHKLLQNALENLDLHGSTFAVTYKNRFPDMICDATLATEMIAPLNEMLGDGSVLIVQASLPFHSEDFAYFMERIPGAMFFLGASNAEEGINAAPHHPFFAVDEKAILIGVKGMSNVLYHYLANH